jgi:hypothetical protein
MVSLIMVSENQSNSVFRYKVTCKGLISGLLLQRKIEERKAKLKETMNNQEEEIQTHPAYAQIRFTRTTGRARFYGSELEQDHYITMEIQRSEITRSLTDDRFFASGLPIIKLRLSSGQFAELITSLNVGQGVPCTLEMVNGVPVEKLPEVENRKEFVHRKFSERMEQFAKALHAKQRRVKELSAKKTLSKDDQSELNRLMEWLTMEVVSNIPFFVECFQETTDKVVLEAKMEVENAIMHKVTSLGMKQLHKQNQLLNGENPA